MRSSTDRFVYPSELISVAEETGLLFPSATGSLGPSRGLPPDGCLAQEHDP